MAKEQLVEVLSKFRAQSISEAELVKQLNLTKNDFQLYLSRTNYLKLKRGNPLPACQQVLQSCNNCESILKEGEFSDYHEFELCDDKLKDAVSNNILSKRPEPSWASVLPDVLGGVGYYECCNCQSVWQLTLPERAQRGSWQRIA